MPAHLRLTQVVSTDSFAGTERYVVDVAAALQRRGHDVAVVGGPADRMRELLRPGVGWRPGSDTASTLRSLAAGGRRDIVHSHMTKADFCALIAAPVTGGRRVSTRHLTVHRGFTPAARRLAPVVRRALAAEIAVSRFVSDAVEVPSDLVLLNGVLPVDRIGPEPERGPVVLVAQRLAPEKDTSTALRAWARSGLAGRGWSLVVAGVGDERPTLEGLAVELGVADSVEWLGWVGDMASLYASCSLLLAPAPTEPCGLTILEAMAAGLPVVAAGAGGNTETLGQEPTAALFAPGDAQAAADHLMRLAGDPRLRLEYGGLLQRLQRERLTLAGHVDRLEELYLRVTGR